jgi:trans-2,3-dihydro-3-hydroxyanthranilate isomerase
MPTANAESRQYVIADVFTSTPLEGNQLAVFTDGAGLTPEHMQRVARELNLSETVFLLAAEQGGDARIRIFTPASELPFAGHPVLGSAFVIGGQTGQSTVRLETEAGIVPVALDRDGDRIVFGRMQQPIPSWEPYARESDLLAALRVERSELPVDAYDNGPVYAYVALESEAAVAALRPDLGALAELPHVGAYCFAGSGSSWKGRMFAPADGIAEDPATGSAAGPLAVHLARHGRIAFGEEIEIRQGAEIARPSILYARVEGAPDTIERVEVSGSAVVVAHGEYRIA